ncbi:MAG: lysozyme inhibitor LprI family protein [Deltaproteobacteria bacterium]
MWLFDLPGKLASFIAALLLLSPALVAGADPKDCMGTATTQSERNQCATSQLKAADDELNRVYQGIVKRYKNDRQFLEKLHNAQQAWLRFRDAELEAKFPFADKRARYGSVYPMCANLFLAQRTQERIKDLRQWLDGTEEGDVCAGSVSYKAEH